MKVFVKKIMDVKSTNYFFGCFFLILTSLWGCTVNSPLIEIMENAYTSSNVPHSQANTYVSKAIQEHFKSSRDIDTILKELSNENFTIIENEKKGWKVWPDGTQKIYPPEIRKNLKINDGQMNFFAKKTYKYGIFETRTAIILIETNDRKNITSIKASININTL